jgi:hypothetical protein
MTMLNSWATACTLATLSAASTIATIETRITVPFVNAVR